MIGLFLLRERPRHLRGHHHQRRQRQVELRRRARRTATPPTGPRTTRPPPRRRRAPAARRGAHDRAQRLGRSPGAAGAYSDAAGVARLPAHQPRGRERRRIRTRPATRRSSTSRRASRPRRPRSPPPSVLPTLVPAALPGHAAGADRAAPASWWSSAPTWPASRRTTATDRRDLTRAVAVGGRARRPRSGPRVDRRCSSTSTAPCRRSWPWRPTPARCRAPCDVLRRAGRALRASWPSCRAGPSRSSPTHLPGVVELHGLYGLEARASTASADRPGRGRGVARGRRRAWRRGRGRRAPGRRRGAQGPLAHAALPRVSPSWRTPPVAWAAGGRRSDRAARCGAAKMSVELHPPVAVDKGTVVRGPAPAGCRRWPTSATTWATSRPSPPSTAWPREGSRRVKVAVRTAEASADAPRAGRRRGRRAPRARCDAPPRSLLALAVVGGGQLVGEPVGRGAGLGERAAATRRARRARRRASSARGGAPRRCRPRRTGARGSGRRAAGAPRPRPRARARAPRRGRSRARPPDATRLSPSRIGLTSSTSARRSSGDRPGDGRRRRRARSAASRRCPTGR